MANTTMYTFKDNNASVTSENEEQEPAFNPHTLPNTIDEARMRLHDLLEVFNGLKDKLSPITFVLDEPVANAAQGKETAGTPLPAAIQAISELSYDLLMLTREMSDLKNKLAL